MAAPCPAPVSGSNFIATTLAHFDCQAKNIGAEGYQALTAAGSSVSIAFTAALTLYIAIIGFRMLRGQLPSGNDLTIAALKIGVVLSLATGWASSRGEVYDTVLRSPAELSGSIGGASGLPGASGGLNTRLQATDDAITWLISVGSGRNELTTVANADPRARIAPPLFSDDFALGLGRTTFTTSLLASFGFLRLFGGLLLAMLPVFAAFLLFDAMRWLFMGWLRSMIAVLLGGVTVAVIVSVELAVMEPWLVNVLAQRSALRPTIEAPFELVAITISFALILFGSLAAVTWLSFSASFSVWVEQRMEQLREAAGRQLFHANDNRQNFIAGAPERPIQDRAFMIAQSVAAAEQRGRAMQFQTVNMADRRTPDAGGNDNGTEAPLDTVPLGQSYRRTTRRVSASAERRSAGT